MSRDVTTRGIVIGRYAAGEGSVRARLYTEALGLVSANAKSAREERSKLRAHVQGGTRGTFSLVKGSYEWRLVGAVGTATTHFELQSPDARHASASVLHLVSQLVRGEEADTFLFDAVWSFLEKLPSCDADEVSAGERLAVFRILFALGYLPKDDAREILFDPTDYSAAAFAQARAEESFMVRAINEGLAASGLT